jgi:hypothetical protein
LEFTRPKGFFFLEFTRPKGTEILWEFTAGNLLEPAVMLNTTDEQHTLSQPTRRRAIWLYIFISHQQTLAPPSTAHNMIMIKHLPMQQL